MTLGVVSSSLLGLQGSVQVVQLVLLVYAYCVVVVFLHETGPSEGVNLALPNSSPIPVAVKCSSVAELIRIAVVHVKERTTSIFPPGHGLSQGVIDGPIPPS